MTQWFALSAIGKDRPGIVADLAELIYECDCNLEDSSMTILGGEFAVLLVLSGVGEGLEERLRTACKRLEWERRLTVFVRPLEGQPVPYGAGRTQVPFQLHAVGVDKAGIVARICRCLADHGINITQLRSYSHPQPQSGTPIYTMRIRLDVPAAVDEAALRRALEDVAVALNVEVTLERLAADAGTDR
jgi:glycine cleavage system transcriptional repressor